MTLLPCNLTFLAGALLLFTGFASPLWAVDPRGGTVDPATVNTRTVFNDQTIANSDDNVYPITIASDSTGSYYTLTFLNERNSNPNYGNYPPRTILTKFEANGILLWRNARTAIKVVTQTSRNEGRRTNDE